MSAAQDFLATQSGRTRDNRTWTLSMWGRWLARRGSDVDQATRQDVEEWLAARRQDGIGPRTIATDLSHLCAYYRWMLSTDRRTDDPTALIRGPRRGRSAARIWLGPGDLTRLLTASLDWYGGELAPQVHLWALSGLRPGEPRILDASALSTHEGRTTLAVTATKTPGLERLVLPEATADLLWAAADGRRTGTLLLHPRTGQPWGRGYEAQRLHLLTQAAGLPPVTPYGLRTSFITLSLQAGIPEREVMIGARHSSSAQTARYDRMRDQVDHAVGPRLARWLACGAITTA